MAHPDTDVLVLTGATAEDYRTELTATVGTALRRATDGSTVLLTASGLQGTHLASLLGHAATEFDLGVSVTPVGHVARLYEDLEYDVLGVKPVETFDSPRTVLEPGAVTVAGPEVPVEGSARRLFEAIDDDPGATLVQATGGGTDPVDAAQCTVVHHELRPHPPEAVVDDVVETIDPLEVVVTHQRGRGLARYKHRYDSFVWATAGTTKHTPYDDGFRTPPWMTDRGIRRVRAAQYDTTTVSAPSLNTEVPDLGRASTVTLEAEGVERTVLTEEYRLDDVGVALSDDDDGPTPESAATSGRDRAPANGVTPASVDGTDSKTDTAAGGSPANDDESDDRRAATGRSGSASGGESDAEDEDEVEAEPPTLARIDRRLSRIEAAIDGEDVRVRVVDAGDGTLLLRVLEESACTALDHGEELTVRLPTDHRE